MSWNKYNLYNLAQRTRYPDHGRKTIFQQLWYAKRETRAYHGASLSEKRWRKLFKSVLPAADTATATQKPGDHPHAAALMYGDLERRLEIFLHRALFADSVESARQMIRHGKVRVDDKTLRYPSYLLEPGQLVSVDPHAIAMLRGKEGTELSYHPKPYSQPFHFLPDYIEVNYRTCEAILLREPISRPGRVEVPSPIPPEVHGLAHEYYVRKWR
ncbi:hypothetical protein BJ684DRAFT_7707 [Piptocephalis cylindrospora]|uniref:RNA-binding S4 domain-containing protein n=1 Tax=Piptocephalis cylindrospora TaxID=1907219 RepID=A0A4P9Y7B5_9FUNG|nr:hypothetical protein BJ684DRAFT_7707 [Piptocephalis cylindrospora]|eukprot:RKP15017.1 hypothetical protein BJ684DRAFT_7707 [Piptocephalis cylindrospora]